MPCATAGAASGPSAVPTYRKRTSGQRSRSAWATASTGVAEPPEPPPASMTCSSVRAETRFVLRPLGEALLRQLHQPRHQLRERQAAGLPQLRIHADLG